jgi:hypothetical protein
VIQVKYQELEQGRLSSDRLKKAKYLLMFTKKCQKMEKLNLKVSYSSTKLNNFSSLFSLLLCLELGDFSTVIFYRNGHLGIFFSTLA